MPPQFLRDINTIAGIDEIKTQEVWNNICIKSTTEFIDWIADSRHIGSEQKYKIAKYIEQALTGHDRPRDFLDELKIIVPTEIYQQCEQKYAALLIDNINIYVKVIRIQANPDQRLQIKKILYE
jgi:hypothetical protein